MNKNIKIRIKYKMKINSQQNFKKLKNKIFIYCRKIKLYNKKNKIQRK